MRRVKFFTLGCKVNQYETQSIRERFLKKGYQEIHCADTADLYLINTCTVTAVAERKSKNIIRRCIKLNPRARVIVTGCLIEKDAGCLSGIKGIDFIIAKRFFPEGINSFFGHTRAFLKIQDGCNNLCSYCKIPHLRGKSRSRALGEIIKEAKELAKSGFKEIVLTGICLGAYGKDLTPKLNLVDILDEFEKIEEILRLRLSSIEAWDITDRLISKLKYSKKICPHLHIPIQSGDDKILKKMNRRINRDDYLEKVQRLRQARDDIAITTDVIVGFPGEEEENFQNTLDLIRRIEPLKIHIFPYSPRPGTVAFYLESNLKAPEVKMRISRLKLLAQESSFNYRSHFLNHSARLLIQGYSKIDSQRLEGFTDHYIKALIKADHQHLDNQLISVVLKEIRPEYMLAELV